MIDYYICNECKKNFYDCECNVDEVRNRLQIRVESLETVLRNLLKEIRGKPFTTAYWVSVSPAERTLKEKT